MCSNLQYQPSVRASWGSRDNASTSGGRDQPHPNRTALASNFARNGVGTTNLVTPEPSSDGDDAQFGQDNGATNGGGNFFGTFDTKSDVTVVVTDGYESLESSTLTGTGLFLYGHDFENLVLQRTSQEEVDNFEFFYRQREKVNFLKTFDLAILDQSAEFGDGDPLFFVFTATTTATSETSTIGWCSVRHT